jgi:hypothetical protein
MEADLAGMSRYAEPQPPTVRPGELDMDNPESFETVNASWPPSTLSNGLLAHRFNALPAHKHNFQNFTNYSTVEGLRGNNASQNLDTLATVSAIHSEIDATRAVSSLGHGHASDIPSLTSPNGHSIYQSIEAHQDLNEDTIFIKKLAEFKNLSAEERKEYLLQAENLRSDGRASGDMEHDDGSSGSSPGPKSSKNDYICFTCGKGYGKKASLT